MKFPLRECFLMESNIDIIKKRKRINLHKNHNFVL